MIVTGHQSIQSLSIYQKVCEDDKLSMGISLTYSLMHPNEVCALLDVIEKETKESKRNAKNPKPIEPPPMIHAIAAPPLPQIELNIPISVENHALDPANKNILPLESALVLYQSQSDKQNEAMDPTESPQFDLMVILSDLDDDQFDNQMVLAATQVDSFKKTSTIMKKNERVQMPTQTFHNCSFGNIGTLNIHVHKH